MDDLDFYTKRRWWFAVLLATLLEPEAKAVRSVDWTPPDRHG